MQAGIGGNIYVKLSLPAFYSTPGKGGFYGFESTALFPYGGEGAELYEGGGTAEYHTADTLKAACGA